MGDASMGAVIKLWDKIISNLESKITYELDDIIYSKKHGQDVCVMRIIGKNIFPIMTSEEILSSKSAIAGLSIEDIIKITRLDMQIRYNKNKLRMIETNRDGTILFEDSLKNRVRYSEELLISTPEIQDKLNGKDAIHIGYKAGFKHGVKASRAKNNLVTNLLHLCKKKLKFSFKIYTID